MNAQPAFTVTVVGSDDDLTRVNATSTGAPDAFLVELTAPDRLDALVKRRPDVAVIGAAVERPLPIAREVRVASPSSEILIILPGERLERFRATLPFVPHLASAWTASNSADAGSLRKVLGEAAMASRQRAATEIVLGRINQQIAARAVHPAEARRSQLVLSERYLATILTQSPDAFAAVDPDGAVIACNDAAIARFGRAIEGGNIVDGANLVEEDKAKLPDLIARAARGETLLAEIRLDTGNEPQFAELSLAPVHDEDGVVASVSLTARDITGRKRAERHQHLLIAELNHRVKNTLAIVQSLAHQTFTRDNPPAEAIKAYEGRLSALATAHNLLTRENWEAAGIRDVVTGALRPFCPASGCRMSGPDVRVEPRIAVSLTLALHELGTNAQKYGSLSVPQGIVDLAWQVTPANELTLCWTEQGGPPVCAPSSSGFGTRMLTRALATDLGGKVDLEFRPDGLVCQIRAPMSQLGVI